MKKTISPKDLKMEIGKAKWEFTKRNPMALKALGLEEYRRTYDEFYVNRPGQHESSKHISFDQFMAECFATPAVKGGSSLFWLSWMKAMRKFLKHPLLVDFNEKQAAYREQILEDAKEILDELLSPVPPRTVLLAFDPEKPKKMIMAEIEELVDKEIELYRKSNVTWVFDENGRVVGREAAPRRRNKWLGMVDELLQVWDLYQKAGQRPGSMTFRDISRQVKRPLSTVKDQWYKAYREIYGEAYVRDLKYTTEEKKETADELCAKCPHEAKCIWASGEWVPCADYLAIAGKEKRMDFLEYRDDLLNDRSIEKWRELEDLDPLDPPDPPDYE